MCIIVDANTASEFVGQSTIESKAIYAWLAKAGRLAVGGRLLEELLDTQFRVILLELDRIGHVNEYNNEDVNGLEQKLAQDAAIKSNDPHVLALALLSCARVLYTRDADLMDDFRNTKILSPKGKIYRYAKRHKKMLELAPKCR